MHIPILERYFRLRCDTDVCVYADLRADGEVECGAECQDARDGDGGYGERRGRVFEGVGVGVGVGVVYVACEVQVGVECDVEIEVQLLDFEAPEIIV